MSGRTGKLIGCLDEWIDGCGWVSGRMSRLILRFMGRWESG